MKERVEAMIPDRRGWSTGAKWAVGCGAGCLTVTIIAVIIVLCTISYFSTSFNKMAQEYAARYEAQGYRKVAGAVCEITTPVTQKTVFAAPVVAIRAECSDDIAIVARVGDISGRVAGDVHFKGQVLAIQPQAVVEGDLDVEARVVSVLGKVEGEITGTYAVLDNRSAP